MLQTLNYGFWETWTNPQKVIFDGDNKLIIVNEGVTSVDVKVDIYSGWKEWMLSKENNNTKYLEALRSVGGDPTVGGEFLGATFFLMNGWRIRTWEGDHRLTVVGNLYTEEGESPFVPTIFPHNIVIESKVSNITTIAGTYPTVSTPSDISSAVWSDPNAVSDSSITAAITPLIPTVQEVAYAVWEEAMFGHATPDSFGKRLKEILPTLWGIR
jgi:hypothetical protein